MIAIRTGLTHRQLRPEGVEGVVLGEVVLPRRERVARKESCAEGHGRGGRCEHNRQRCDRQDLHEVVTWSTGEKPTTNPWPELTRAR